MNHCEQCGVQGFEGGEDSATKTNSGHLILPYLLESKDRELWLRTYETLRADKAAEVAGWEKTFKQAQQQGQLPAWRE